MSGAGLAAQLQNSLGYPVSKGEPYYTPGCTSSLAVRVPERHHPEERLDGSRQHLLQYIPLPNDGPTTFAGAEDERFATTNWAFALTRTPCAGEISRRTTFLMIIT